MSLDTHLLLNISTDRGSSEEYGGGMRARVLERRIEGIEGVWSRWLQAD